MTLRIIPESWNLKFMNKITPDKAFNVFGFDLNLF